MRRALWSVPVVAIVVLLLAYGFGRDPSGTSFTLIGKPAPRFILDRIDRGHLNLASLHGKPVVLNFWASWCVACRQEQDALVRAYHRWGRHVAFVGVVFEDDVSAVRTFLRQHGGGWTNVADPGSQVAIDYGVSGVPETFFVRPSGIVVAKITGPISDHLWRQYMHLLLHGRPA